MLKGVKKATPESSRRRLPIIPTILRVIKAVWQKDPSPRDARMLWAASCQCFFGFLRSGEIVCPTEPSFDRQSHAPCLCRRYGGPQVSPFRDTGSHQGIQDRPLPARGYTAHRCGRRRTLSGGGSAHVHGLQGWRPWPAIYMGGRSIPYPRSIRGRCTGCTYQRGLQRDKLCRSQLSNRRCNHGLTTWNPGLSHPDPGSMAEQCLYLLYTNGTGNLTRGSKDPSSRLGNCRKARWDGVVCVGNWAISSYCMDY